MEHNNNDVAAWAARHDNDTLERAALALQQMITESFILVDDPTDDDHERVAKLRHALDMIQREQSRRNDESALRMLSIVDTFNVDELAAADVEWMRSASADDCDDAARTLRHAINMIDGANDKSPWDVDVANHWRGIESTLRIHAAAIRAIDANDVHELSMALRPIERRRDALGVHPATMALLNDNANALLIAIDNIERGES
jgi:hypothetical protein